MGVKEGDEMSEYNPHIIAYKEKNKPWKVTEHSNLDEAMEYFTHCTNKPNKDTVILAKRIRKSVW